MQLRHAFAFAGLAVSLANPASAAAGEGNAWPVKVTQFTDTGAVRSWQGAGPLFFSQPLAEGMTASGFRPFYVATRSPDGELQTARYLYPAFVYRNNDGVKRWSLFQLVNWNSMPAGASSPRGASGFDVWPFYFSRNTGSSETSYHALFPIYGTVKNRLFNERASWVLFPLYARTLNKGVEVTSAPWPFIRFVRGAGNSGFSLWPLFGWRKNPGVFHREFYLWPLVYNDVSRQDEREPAHSFGVLPFYARESGPGVRSETYLWPFFGYADRNLPFRYTESRYFWPLFIQGRGDQHYRNRWAPFYTHSVVLGVDKTWVMWPLFRRAQWTDDGIEQTKTQLLYFLYWSRVQHSASNPQLAPAEKSGVWPLYSLWNNGAGKRQFQLLSPFEAFFPDNEGVRLAWAPLFAVYRRDEPAPGDVRHSLLFDLITWHHTPAAREFHLGPLLAVESGADGGRMELAGGLLGLKRGPAGGWRPFWFDFSSRAAYHSASL